MTDYFFFQMKTISPKQLMSFFPLRINYTTTKSSKVNLDNTLVLWKQLPPSQAYICVTMECL